jgi:hypothetical protein
MTRRLVRAGLVAWVLALPWVPVPPPGLAAAADPEGRIDRVTAVRVGREVTVSAHLAGGFPPEIADEIRSGVPKDLFYTIALNRRHRRWFDEELASATVQFQIKYDTLAGHYTVRRIGPQGGAREQELEDYDAAVGAISTVEGVGLALPKGSRDYTHYVSAKAEMRAVELPLYLDYVFFFIPRLEYETPWARSAYLEAMP